ncbi:MAG: hypothetical protein IT342_13535 [Candidatus Melainabacteria bacterium]|nr:hypothetical protein [Candidatus Melainabacteria bacterium]
MKITDKLGRSLSVDVVVKAPQFDMWMEPLGYNLTDSDTQFLRVSEGQFALRVMSKLGCDLLVHLNGKLLLSAAVPKGIQYVECDQQGNPFFFVSHAVMEAGNLHGNAPFADGVMVSASDGGTADGITSDAATANGTTGDGVEDQATVPQASLAAPFGDGVVFVVARFADDPIYGACQPPRQEITATFQLQAPADHDKRLAGNLSRLVQPALPDEPDEVFKLTSSGRPKFVCTCTGCNTGKGHAH